MKHANFKLAAILLIGLGVLSVSLPYVVRSFVGDAPKVIVEGDYLEASSGQSVSDSNSSDQLGGLVERGERNFLEKVTMNTVAYGSEYKLPLNFSKTATTTPGKLFSVLNDTVKDRWCDRVIVDVTSGSTINGLTGVGSSYQFSVGTSTSATMWSNTGANLTATTTVASTTAAFFVDSIRSPGSYVGGDQDQGGAPWIWSAGTYLLGAFDTTTNASSSAYIIMSGNVYIDCKER